MTASQLSALAADREKARGVLRSDSHLVWLLLAVLTIIAAALGLVRLL